MRMQTRKKSRQTSKETERRKKPPADVLTFKRKERRPFEGFSEEIRQFLIDNDYSE